MREEFRGKLGADFPDPAEVIWDGRCEHADGETCFCLSVHTTAAVYMDLGPQPEEREGQTRLGFTLPLDAAECDRLIGTLQRARRAVFGLPPVRAVTLEVVQRGSQPAASGTGTLILPNAVLINGQPVYTAGGVKVHEMDIAVPRELAQVTVTLPARLVVIGAETDIAP